MDKFDIIAKYPMPFNDDIDDALMKYPGWWGCGVSVETNIRDHSIEGTIEELEEILDFFPGDVTYSLTQESKISYVKRHIANLENRIGDYKGMLDGASEINEVLVEMLEYFSFKHTFMYLDDREKVCKHIEDIINVR